MLTDRHNVGVTKLGPVDWFPIQACAAGTLEIFEKVNRLYLGDLGMSARDGMVVDGEIVVGLSADRNRITSYNVCYTKLLRMTQDEEAKT